ncbi:membrane protein, partial [gut metagenome]
APCDVNTMVISSIMLLVPGLMITNALRDSVMGEPLSALVLLTEAVLVACAIALGALTGLYIMGQ